MKSVEWYRDGNICRPVTNDGRPDGQLAMAVGSCTTGGTVGRWRIFYEDAGKEDEMSYGNQ